MVNVFWEPDPVMFSDIRCCSPFHAPICRLYLFITVLPLRARSLLLDVIFYSPGRGIDLTFGRCFACAGEKFCRETMSRDWNFKDAGSLDGRRKIGWPPQMDRLTGASPAFTLPGHTSAQLCPHAATRSTCYVIVTTHLR